MGAGMDIRFCWVMCTSVDEARRIGRTLVEERLAASANLLSPAASIYWWQGQIEEATETPLVLKTKAELVPALTARVASLHAYALPCIVALPVSEAHPPYLAWVAKETKSMQ